MRDLQGPPTVWMSALATAAVAETCGSKHTDCRRHVVATLCMQFFVPNMELRSKVYGELVEPLLGLEAESGRNWRLQLDLLSALAE